MRREHYPLNSLGEDAKELGKNGRMRVFVEEMKRFRTAKGQPRKYANEGDVEMNEVHE